jgi:hypothetical protein
MRIPISLDKRPSLHESDFAHFLPITCFEAESRWDVDRAGLRDAVAFSFVSAKAERPIGRIGRDVVPGGWHFFRRRHLRKCDF